MFGKIVVDSMSHSWRRKFEAFNASKQIKEDKHFDYQDSNEDVHQHMLFSTILIAFFEQQHRGGSIVTLHVEISLNVHSNRT